MPTGFKVQVTPHDRHVIARARPGSALDQKVQVLGFRRVIAKQDYE